MKKISGGSWALLVVFLIGGCGGDSPQGGGGGEAEVKTLKRGGKDGSQETESSGGPETGQEPISREEARRRAILDQLKQRLEGAQDGDTRAEVLAELPQFGPAARGLLHLAVKALDDPEPMTRAEAITAVAAIDPRGCRSFLEGGLRDAEAEVRQRAAEAWGQAEIADLIPLLDHASNEIDEKVQGAVMLVVEARGQPVLAPQVARILDDLDDTSVVFALRFFEAKKAVAQVDAVVELLNRNAPLVRIKAAETLLAFGVKSPQVLGRIIRALEDEDGDVRKAASKTLVKLTGQDLGFRSWDEPEKREETIKAWQEWLKANEKTLGS